ncbi:MAG TPA: hypothetical protein PKC47_12525 [Petrimonas sp.]|nr:hypothetical protein [Petrimonas sp.]
MNRIRDIWERIKEGDPILVYNPYTEKTTNIEPFFRFVRGFNEFEDCWRITDYAAQSLARAPLTEGFEETEHETRVLELDYLFKLRDVFKDLMECEISTPKRR